MPCIALLGSSLIVLAQCRESKRIVDTFSKLHILNDGAVCVYLLCFLSCVDLIFPVYVSLSFQRWSTCHGMLYEQFYVNHNLTKFIHDKFEKIIFFCERVRQHEHTKNRG